MLPRTYQSRTRVNGCECPSSRGEQGLAWRSRSLMKVNHHPVTHHEGGERMLVKLAGNEQYISIPRRENQGVCGGSEYRVVIGVTLCGPGETCIEVMSSKVMFRAGRFN